MSEEKIMGFEEILGNEMVKDHFKKAIQNHKISHAYILTGEAGMGRKSIANAFAMTLLCEKGGSEPCMICHSCKQVMSGNHPDLIYVTHEKPGSIGVDDVREQINDTIMIRPYSSYYKIYIVDEAEKMTVQAQNALLKTIEEPPSYAVIILITTNQEAFLPTILSRCVQMKLKPLKDFTIKSYLTQNLHIAEKDADIPIPHRTQNAVLGDKFRPLLYGLRISTLHLRGEISERRFIWLRRMNSRNFSRRSWFS